MMKPYPCRVPLCSEASSFYAKDNKATFGHVCTKHFKEFTKDECDNYALDVDVLKPYLGDT